LELTVHPSAFAGKHRLPLTRSCTPLRRQSRRSLQRSSNLSIDLQLNPSLHLSLLVREHRPRRHQLRLELRQQVRRQRDSALNLDLDLNLHRLLHHEMLAELLGTLHQQSLASSLGSNLDSMLRTLPASTPPALHRQKLQSRRPPGHGVGGRIVAQNGRTTTCRQDCTTMQMQVSSNVNAGESYKFVGWMMMPMDDASNQRADS